MKLKMLVGSGDKIMLSALPFLVVGLALNILDPVLFSVGGPALAIKAISMLLLIPGVVVWLWSVALIATKASKNKLITNGPYSLVKHPLYTSVALLVLPWVGFIFNTWLGALVGIVIYLASRIYSPREEKYLSQTFGSTWDEYSRYVKLKWI